MNKHLTSEEIELLVKGLIPEEDRDQWLEHLETCDRCLSSVDRAWPHLKADSDTYVPALDAERETLIRSRVLRRIHALEMGRQSLRLIILAPLEFLQGLLGAKRR